MSLFADQISESSGRQDPAGLAQTLQQEFSLVNLQIRNVNVEVGSFLPHFCKTKYLRLDVSAVRLVCRKLSCSLSLDPPPSFAQTVKCSCE